MNAVGRMIERNERTQAQVARLDAWLNGHEQTHPDWEYQYAELRKARRRITRTRKAYLRLELCLFGENEHTRAALNAMDGKSVK